MAIFVAMPTMVGAGATGGFNWKEFGLNQLVQQFQSEEFDNNANSTTYTVNFHAEVTQGFHRELTHL